jgi:hypothetical protein
MIYDLSPDLAREPDCLVTPPNSSIMFAQCAAIPQLKGELLPGTLAGVCGAGNANGQPVNA